MKHEGTGRPNAAIEPNVPKLAEGSPRIVAEARLESRLTAVQSHVQHPTAGRFDDVLQPARQVSVDGVSGAKVKMKDCSASAAATNAAVQTRSRNALNAGVPN
jgi:hypothetical protein